MTLEQLDAAIKRDVQLHESFELCYVVDGWVVTYTPDDGDTELEFHGATPVEAMTACFSAVRNHRGRG